MRSRSLPSRLVRAFPAAAALALAALPAAAQCPTWLPDLPPLAADEFPRDVVVHDGGLGTTVWCAYTRNAWDALELGGVKRLVGNGWVDMGAFWMTRGFTDLRVFDDGSGPALFASGRGVARLSAQGWLGVMPESLTVHAIEIVDLGSGPELWVVGQGTSLPQASVCRWITAPGFEQLGSNIGHASTVVYDVAACDLGSGLELVIAGHLHDVTTGTTHGVMRRVGQTWVPVGASVPQTPRAHGFVVYDQPAPRTAYAVVPVGADSAQLTRWNGTSWSPVAGAFTRAGGEAVVRELAVHADDPLAAPRIFAAGSFDAVGGQPVRDVARWNGASWSALGSGVVASGTAGAWMLAPIAPPAPHATQLAVGGAFTQAGSAPSFRLASWSQCSSGTAFCFGDGSGAACPCGNASPVGARAGCLQSLGVGGRLEAAGQPSVAADTLGLFGGQMPNSSALYFQGTSTVSGGAGVAFGDGLRCASGTLIRLGTKANVGGGSRYPDAGDVGVAVRGQCAPGNTRHYQVWYRNAAAFCTASTYNLTNALSLTWNL